MTFDFKKTKEKVVPLTPNNILDRITPIDIYSRYLGYTPVVNRQNYKSPFRDNDDTPSFGLFRGSRTGDLMFKDLGGEKYAGNCFIFVQKLYNESFTDSLKRINQDFQLGLGQSNNAILKTAPIIRNIKDAVPKERAKIDFDPRPFRNEDFRFWSQFGIDQYTLACFNVSPVRDFWVDGSLRGRDVPGYPMYAYEFKAGKYVKIYRPKALALKDKWRSNCPNEILEGFEQLPEEGELLVITKSLKDVMVYSTFNIPAVAPQSEVPKLEKHLVEELSDRFTNIVVNYDNDDTGKKNGEILSSTNKWDRYEIPLVYQAKDISDLYKAYGHEQTFRLIENDILCLK